MSELKAWEPTWREQLAAGLQRYLEMAGVPRHTARRDAQSILGGPSSRLPGSLGLVDPTLLSVPLDVQEAGLMAGQGAYEGTHGNPVGGLLRVGMATAPMVLLGKGAKPSAADVKVSRARVGTTGKYVGAPAGVDSPAKVGALTRKYEDAMAGGVPGRTFYRNSSADVFARTGNNPSEADLVAQNLAQLSRSNNVGGNTTMSAKGHIQAVSGEAVHTGRFPSKDSPPLQAMYDTGLVEYQGHKRDPFATQLGVAWNPGRIGRGVNDMHEAEIFGYPSGKVGGPTQHAFMDRVRAQAIEHANAKKLGGISDWDTGTGQAAAWTWNKIRRGEVKPGDAAKDYTHYLPRLEANATYEQVSSPAVGHLAGLLDAPYEQRLMYTLDPRGSWNTSASGRDIGYTAARALPGESLLAVGRFGDSANPAFVARPLTAINTSHSRPPSILPVTGPDLTEGSKGLLDVVEASRAYFDAQEAGAWHKLLDVQAPDYTGASVTFGREFTPSDMKAVAPLFEKHGYYLGSAPDGVTILANEWTKSGAEMAKEVRGIIKENSDIFSGSKVKFGRAVSSYLGYGDEWAKGKGAVTKKYLEYMDRNPTTAALLEANPEYRAAVLARNARDIEYAAKGYGVAREDVLRARQIFHDGGRPALKRAAEAGIVPAVLLAPGAAMLFGGEGDRTVD